MNNEKELCEEATGVQGAGNYRDVAKKQGYKFLDVFDWTSSAGDWSFIVSEDGIVWRMMFQTNNFPRAGFTYAFGDALFEGTKEDALRYFEEDVR